MEREKTVDANFGGDSGGGDGGGGGGGFANFFAFAVEGKNKWM